jgi:hypothetical protein
MEVLEKDSTGASRSALALKRSCLGECQEVGLAKEEQKMSFMERAHLRVQEFKLGSGEL